MAYDPLLKVGPLKRVIRWVDYRLPIFSLLEESLVRYKVPKNLSYWWCLGSLAGILLVMMILSGLFLAMHYDPNPAHAFQSVERIMREVNFGWLIRYIHMNGASFFFIVVYLHMLRGMYYGSYKAPRELLWILGVFIFFAMMATAFMGYVLPWGQMSFWGATVITNLFTAIPLMGESILHWLLGGFAVGAPTLNRFFALHYLMPFIIVTLVLLHLWALHRFGSNNPTGLDIKSAQDEIPFHPYYTLKDLLALTVFLMIFVGFVCFAPNFFGEPDNYVEANPMVTPAHIVPEWYFLPFYAILRAIPDKFLGVVALFSSIGILFFLPWLDGSKIRSAAYKPIYRALFWVFVMNGILLGWLGAKPPEGAYILMSRLATTFHFLYFLVLVPLISRWEKPTALPASISADYERRHPKSPQRGA